MHHGGVPVAAREAVRRLSRLQVRFGDVSAARAAGGRFFGEYQIALLRAALTTIA